MPIERTLSPLIVGILPPMERRVGLPEGVGGADHDDFANLAQKTVVDQVSRTYSFLHQAEGAGDDLLDEVGMPMGRPRTCGGPLRRCGPCGLR